MSLVTLNIADEVDEYYKIGDYLLELCRRYDDNIDLLSTVELYDCNWMSYMLHCDIAWKRIQEFLLDYPRFKDNVAKKSQIYEESKGYFSKLVLESNDHFPLTCIRTSCYKCGKEIWKDIIISTITTDGINEVKCNDCPSKILLNK